MLDPDYRQVKFQGESGAQVVRMQVGRNILRFNFKECSEPLVGLFKKIEVGEVIQISDMLAHKRVVVPCKTETVF